jgi:hypothetical protein
MVMATMPRSPNPISNLPLTLTIPDSDHISDDLVTGD